MITYQDGTQMKVGDSVLIEEGSTPGVITNLIELGCGTERMECSRTGGDDQIAAIWVGIHTDFYIQGGSHHPRQAESVSRRASSRIAFK